MKSPNLRQEVRGSILGNLVYYLVGLFYWGTTLGESAPQAIIKSNAKGWDFNCSGGSGRL